MYAPTSRPVGVERGHVLRGVDGDVDPAVEQCLLELLDEHAAAADLTERPRSVTVAGGGDGYERDLDPGPPHRLRRALGLDESEPTAAGTDAQKHDNRDSTWCADVHR